MPRPVNYSDRVLLVGRTQSGKSTLARYLAAHMHGARLLLINVKGTENVGVDPVYDVAAIDWAAPVVDFIPRTMDRRLFEDLYEAIFSHGGPRVVWLDEAMAVTRANYAPDRLLLVQQQGDRLGIGHLYCSQRPQEIAGALKSECEHIFVCGSVFTARDLQALSAEMGMSGDQLGAQLRDLHAEHGDYAFLWYCRSTGELEWCEPLPQAWSDHVPVGRGGTPGDPPRHYPYPSADRASLAENSAP